MNNDKIKIIISLPLVLATILSTTTVVLPLLAYAQEEGRPDMATNFGGDASPEAEKLAFTIATDQIWNLTDKDPTISFSEDGTLQISSLDSKLMTTIIVEHPLTPEAGYRYDNSQIFAPNGSKVFP